MFTGIIQAVGQINQIQRFAEDARLEINAKALDTKDVKVGDSIAVNGVCLTVVELQERCFKVDASLHTLEKTTLGKLNIGQNVNLEKCLQLQSYVGGHLVTGHVDGIAELLEKKASGRAQELVFQMPEILLPFIAVKGSITIDGVSLTVNNLAADKMSVAIIPHTLENTTLAELTTKNKVNVEVDLLARYAARWFAAANSSDQEKWFRLLDKLS